MPVVTIDWLEGRTDEQKRRLTEALTHAFVEVAKVPAANTKSPRDLFCVGQKLREPKIG